MKKYILFLFLGLIGTLNAQKIELNVLEIRQQQSRWCGAASSQCVLYYYSKWGVLQCEIMEYVRSKNPGMYGFTNCCANPTPPDCNNKGLDFFGGVGSGSVGDVLEQFGPVYTNEVPWYLFFLEIKNYLTMKRPIIVHWADITINNGHAVVIYGIDGNNILYMDPWPGEDGGCLSLPYDEFVDDGYILWWNTLNMKINPPENPEEPQDPEEPEEPQDKCSNCVRDPGEVGIDCGGANCPPCEDVPIERWVSRTEELSSEVMAIRQLRVAGGMGKVVIENGKEVSFITEERGSVLLRPGFKAEKGSHFTTQRWEDLSGYNRICPEKLCRGASISYLRVHGLPGSRIYNLYLKDLLHAVKIEYDLYDERGLIGSAIFNVTNNGDVRFWQTSNFGIEDLTAGTYIINYIIHYCTGAILEYWGMIVIVEHKNKSLNEESDETENFDSPQSSSSAHLNIQDEMSTPTLSIIPNPNSGTFQIETNISLSDIANLKVTNMLGATIYETQNLSSNIIQLPASASGQYLVVIVLKDGNVLTQKMLIQR